MNLSRKFSAALALMAVTVATPAFALDSGLRTVNIVEFLNSGTPSQLLVQLSDGNNYYANVGQSPGCGIVAPNVDTVKTWVSMAQAAMLSGKNSKIYYITCGGSRFITVLDIYQ